MKRYHSRTIKKRTIGAFNHVLQPTKSRPSSASEPSPKETPSSVTVSHVRHEMLPHDSCGEGARRSEKKRCAAAR